MSAKKKKNSSFNANSKTVLEGQQQFVEFVVIELKEKVARLFPSSAVYFYFYSIEIKKDIDHVLSTYGNQKIYYGTQKRVKGRCIELYKKTFSEKFPEYTQIFH